MITNQIIDHLLSDRPNRKIKSPTFRGKLCCKRKKQINCCLQTIETEGEHLQRLQNDKNVAKQLRNVLKTSLVLGVKKSKCYIFNVLLM